MREPGVPSAYVFDMDGVLIDSERPTLGLLQRLLSEAGVERDLASLRVVCGRPAGFLNGYLAPLFDHDERALAAFKERYAQGKLEHLESGAIHVFPHTHDVLTFLRQRGLGIALATSTARELALRRLGQHDLERHFDRIVTGDQVTNGKPAPDIFLRAAEALGVEPARCVVVEDSLVGVEAGRSAGMTVFAIAKTYPAEELDGAHRVFESMGELHAFIQGEATLARSP